ncbi:MAG: putative sensor domain DACNV-containing protein [Desulfobulbus sp.]
MHVYPSELVALITQRWNDATTSEQGNGDQPLENLPGKVALEQLISTCYQVSMMREEDRPVTLRLTVASPELFPPDQGPPKGFLRVLFSSPRSFNEYELRRLSPAVDFERSLIGIAPHPEKGFEIWGLVNSGIRWLQEERGGNKKTNQLPDTFGIHVTGPGMLTICRGLKIIATLNSGRLLDSTANAFQSKWMNKLFAEQRENLLQMHEAFRASVLYPVAKIQDEFIDRLQFQLLKRVISVTRISRHGGTFIIFPSPNPSELSVENPYIQIKYRFLQDEAIQRQQNLMIRTIRLATTALGDINEPDKIVTWKDYVELRHESAVYDLEEALYEQAQFVASLASVDGAVVTSGQAAIGFGGMIVGSLDKLTEVAIANDIEGKMLSLAKIEGYGSRHRSVYHLCNAIHHVMAIVVSQDGNVQLAKWRNGIVTCWDLTSQMFIGDN